MLWTIVGFVAKITGFGKVVSTLIVLGLFAAAATGTYVYWKQSVIHQNNLKWEARMEAEKKRVEAIIAEENKKSSERITAMLKKQIELQEQIEQDEEAIVANPDRDNVGLSADSVSRINRIN